MSKTMNFYSDPSRAFTTLTELEHMPCKEETNMRLAHCKRMLSMVTQELELIERGLKSQEASNPDIWITTQETAKLCNISKATLCRMAVSGACEAKRVGQQWRFPKSRVIDMSFIYPTEND